MHIERGGGVGAQAIALIGCPSVLVLDEPSTGLDPFARRKLWQALRAGQAYRATLLTTHSMAEADAICQRIGIMVNGSLRCLGSSQELKSEHGGGYILELKARPGADMERVERCVQDVLSVATGQLTGHHLYVADVSVRSDDQNASNNRGSRRSWTAQQGGGAAHLLEQFAGRWRYALPKSAGDRLPNLFRQLGEAKRSGVVEDYSVSQTTLEQVFIRMAREQNE